MSKVQFTAPPGVQFGFNPTLGLLDVDFEQETQVVEATSTTWTLLRADGTRDVYEGENLEYETITQLGWSILAPSSGVIDRILLEMGPGESILTKIREEPLDAAVLFAASSDLRPTGNSFGLLVLQRNDEIRGSAGREIIDGWDGDDDIRGRGGDDILRGNGGNDVILGEAGDDEIYGETNYSNQPGEGGDDRLYGNWGNDRLYGGPGNDTLHGGRDNDELSGEYGDDELNGDRGDDNSAAGPVPTPSTAARATTSCMATSATTSSTAAPGWTRCGAARGAITCSTTTTAPAPASLPSCMAATRRTC